MMAVHIVHTYCFYASASTSGNGKTTEQLKQTESLAVLNDDGFFSVAFIVAYVRVCSTLVFFIRSQLNYYLTHFHFSK